MLPILSFREHYELPEDLQEAADAESKQQNKTGVLHELLVGQALNGGKHMTPHPAQTKGPTAQEVHDRYATDLYGSNFAKHPEYLDQRAKAQAAAEKIKAEANKPIKGVYWTSKAGDVAAITGRNNSQEEDTSDVYLDHGKQIKDPRERFTGVSLKSVEKKNGHAPVSNPGRISEEGKLKINTDDILQASRDRLRKAHPGFKRVKTAAEAKAVRKSDDRAKSLEEKERGNALSAIAKAHADAYSKLKKPEVVKHLRTMLRAHDTGFNHLRLTTGGTGGDFTTNVERPAEDHEHIFSSPQHISVTSKGNSVVFAHKGKPFFRHRLKAADSAGLFGSIKLSGENV